MSIVGSEGIARMDFECTYSLEVAENWNRDMRGADVTMLIGENTECSVKDKIILSS